VARAKARRNDAGQLTGCWIWCPACGYAHLIAVKPFPFDNGAAWDFNGDFDRPTFSPSLNCNPDDPSRRCHSIITDGRISYCSDSFHGLKGQTAELPEWESLPGFRDPADRGPEQTSPAGGSKKERKVAKGIKHVRRFVVYTDRLGGEHLAAVHSHAPGTSPMCLTVFWSSNAAPTVLMAHPGDPGELDKWYDPDRLPRDPLLKRKEDKPPDVATDPEPAEGAGKGEGGGGDAGGD
jgi:hypothetical protein